MRLGWNTLAASMVAFPMMIGCKDDVPVPVPVRHPPHVCQPPEAFVRDLAHVDPASRRSLFALFGPQMKPGQRPIWFDQWMRDTSPAGYGSRFFIGATEPLYQTLCNGTANRSSGRLDKYQEAMREFFSDYYSRRREKRDNDILVLVAGLAPTQLDDLTAMAVINDLMIPTTPPSLERDAVTEFGQVLKFGYYVNRMADLAGEDQRFRLYRKRVQLYDSDLATARMLKREGEKIRSDIRPDRLYDRQRAIWNTLLKVWGQLLKST